LEQRDITRLKAEEMKFMIRKAGYSLLGHRKYEDIPEEIKTEPVERNLR
jgi:hypothetical protein